MGPLYAVLATRALEASKAAQARERRPSRTPAPRLGERALDRVRRRVSAARTR